MRAGGSRDQGLFLLRPSGMVRRLACPVSVYQDASIAASPDTWYLGYGTVLYSTCTDIVYGVRPLRFTGRENERRHVAKARVQQSGPQAPSGPSGFSAAAGALTNWTSAD